MPIPIVRKTSQVDSAVRFDGLVEIVQACQKCPAMAGKRRCLSRLNGNLESKIVFVAEAPGAAGAARHGIPLGGIGPSGENFKAMLKKLGKAREDVFVINAVACHPDNGSGRNRRPTDQEVANCFPHLKKTLEILNPAVVVAFGNTALQALAMIAPHSVRLSASGTPVDWWGRKLVPLYHPSPRALEFRSPEQQFEDLRSAMALVEGHKLQTLGSKGDRKLVQVKSKVARSRPLPQQVQAKTLVTEKPEPGEGSGTFIKRLWMTGKYAPDDLVAAVHANWEGRTTRRADVYWNYRRLIEAGTENVPSWPGKGT